MAKHYLFAAIFMVLGSNARGQWVWNMTHAPVIGDTQYAYTALDCHGLSCTAAGIKTTNYTDVNKVKVWVIMDRSDDGGKTWFEQNPGLSPELGENQRQIRGIQQIDSLNVIAYGDTGLILRTTDAGVTWNDYSMNTSSAVRGLDFSDSLNGIGIVFNAGSSNNLWVTSNGGVSWDSIKFDGIQWVSQWLSQCHTEGVGKYEILTYGAGKLYSTSNNWQTVDSSAVIDTSRVVLAYFTFSETGDTIAVRGESYDSLNPSGIIYISTDRGARWIKAHGPEQIGSAIGAMTGFDHDTLFAAGLALNHILVSADAGFDWTLDTLLLDTNYICYGTLALAMTQDGNPIGAFTETPFNGNSILARGVRGFSAVTNSPYFSRAYTLDPDPAMTTITISGLPVRGAVHFLDILGRDMLTATVPATGTLALDVSQLPRGMYMVMVEEHGTMVPAGRVILN